MKSYTSIPVQVFAVKFNGENQEEIKEFAKDCVWFTGFPGVPLIQTKEGQMRVDVGDYVVKEPFPTGDRDFYPCKGEIFDKRYRLTDEA